MLRQRSSTLCACSAILLVTTGCQTLLAGPYIASIYRVTASEVGVIDSHIEGHRHLRIDHAKLKALLIVASPGGKSRPAEIRLSVTPKEGVTVALMSDTLRVRGCDEVDWSPARFKVLTGGYSSTPRPPLEPMLGRLLTVDGKTSEAAYAIRGDLPGNHACLQAELPALSVNQEELRIGLIEFRLGEIRVHAFGS